MAKQVFKQHAFNAGEMSPQLYGRFDISKYKNALKTSTNAFLFPQGPVKRRNGTQFIKEVKSSANTTRLIPFQFSATDAFVLEFGNNYIRFYQDKANVEDGGSPVEVTTTYTSAQVDDISYVQFGNSIYLAHPDHPPRQLIRNSTTSWDLKTITFSPPATTEIGLSGPVGITLSATTGNNITVTADSAFFQEGDIGRQIVAVADNTTGIGSIDSRTSDTVVSINIIEDFDTTTYSTGEWLIDLSPLGQISIAAVGGGSGSSGETITVTSSGSGTPPLFKPQQVGKYLNVHGGVAEITARNSNVSIECVVQKSLDSTEDTSVWSIEDESWSSARGYPKAVGLFQGRLIFGGTTEDPQTIWMSEESIYDGFGAGADDEDSVVLDVSSLRANEISWISSARNLVVGTTGAEISLEPSSAGPITPSNPPDQVKTLWGSAVQTPLIIGDEIVFIGGNGQKIRSFKYDFNIDGYSAEDLLFLSSHFTSSSITLSELAYANDPFSTIYAVLSDGNMLVGTYERAQEVIGWSKYTTDGSYEKVTVISENNEDVVYTIVNRTIDGSTVRYVEAFDSGDGSDETHIFSDSAIEVRPDSETISGITQASPGVVTTSGSHGFSDGDTVYMMDIAGMTELNGNIYTIANSTSTTFELTNSSGTDIDTSSFTAYTSGGTANKRSTAISGLDHLEGETVEIRSEGAVVPSKTVSSGAITLETESGIVVIGQPYTTTIQTLRYPMSTLSSQNISGRIRWTNVELLVDTSSPPTVNGESITSRNGDDDMDSAVPLFSGFYEYSANDWDDTGELTITKSGPFPMILLGIFGYGEGSSK